ncbi:helix-turn-helix domain-containing protein [Marilutibacter chinensis]|uniref:DUF4115 domain-containing protein n=1 Tax=Marilutibacter chinensis TaxID=2912247 RepID=A0ABS9HNC4_9GAMM|nr:RodZ domain-containing protein [Lysobacter chinensis]MCF7220501.1 DUF4115 domain-containing protein [Lysobacter chinensis]
MIQPDPIESGSVPSCGSRLRQAREAGGLTREEVSSRLKMPLRVVEALENDEWEVLGAPIFVRGQLRSYARLLKLDMDVDGCLDQAHVPRVAPPELVSHSHTPRYRRVLEQATRNTVYIVMTAAIALPVWWATRDHLSPSSGSPDVQSLEVPDGLAPARQDEPAATSAQRPARTPVVASMTPRSIEKRSSGGISLVFNDESWIEVFGPEGHIVEKGLVPAGESRRYEDGEVGRMTVGNVSAIELRHDGELVDLSAFSKSNVARFTLSSDGSVVPPAE